MKRWIRQLLIVAALAIGDQASAHPGRTNAAGCHTCKTNCPKWGLDFGEYHCQGSRSTSPPPPPPPPLRREPPRTLESPPSGGGTIRIEPSQGSHKKVGLQAEGIAVVDGETFVVRQAGEFYLLRLRDIEAPELEEPHGREARDRLATSVVGRTLLVEAERGRGCVIAVRARSLDGEDLAGWLVAAGLARVKPEAPEALRLLERRARLEKKGLWE